MPTRFDAYRMRDGVTPLSEDYFTPVLRDIDARIAEIEDRRADLLRVIDDLSAFGLQRIDTLIGPAVAELNAMLDDLRSRRDELVAAIANVGDLATQAQLGAAIAAEQTARQAAIAAEQTARQAAIAQATAPASAIAITLDASGRIATFTETLPGGARSTTLTYDTAGRLASAVIVQGDLTRTETYAYDAQGRLIGITATETTA